MAKETDRPNTGGDFIQANIGDNANQVAVGKNIVQKQLAGEAGEVTEADLDEIRKLFADFKQQVEQEAPPDKKAAALERAGELQDELTSKKPSLSTVEYVRNWFVKNAPGLLGGLTSLVVNPLVGKVVQAAGEMAADEFKRRFGGG